ncbi:MAG: conjugal transfer protein TraF [Candidatus Paracaedibacter sp.]
MASFKYLTLILVCSSLFVEITQTYNQPKHAKTWYEAPDQGWSWYIDPPKRSKPKKQTRDQETPSTKVETSYVHTEEMEKLRKGFEELQAKAILNPTLENVQAFQKAYNSIVNRSSSFEKTWMLSSLISGESYRVSDQHSPKHRKIYQEKTDKQLEEDIVGLVRTHGLFFIFKNDCPYCHEMAPIVRQLVDQYHFEVKAISPDGETLKEFPEAVKDNGTISQINPEGVFPTLFLVNPNSGQTIPLARGLTSPSELKDNLKVIIQFLKEQPHVQ